ncbi:MAG: hypothetical protein AAB820_00855 [Patescibacteria group bacterium]
MLVCPSCAKAVKVGYAFNNKVKKRRCKKCEAAI